MNNSNEQKIEKFANWLQKHKSEKNTLDYQTVQNEYNALIAPPPPPKIQKETGSYIDDIASGAGRVFSGAGKSLQNNYYGIKGLGTDLSPEEKATIVKNDQFISDNPFTAGIGAFGAEAASFLIPGGVVAKAGTKILTSAPKIAALLSRMPKAAQTIAKVGSQIGTDAALEYGYTPEDENRAQNAALMAAFSGGVRTVAGGISLFKDAKAKKLAQALIQQTEKTGKDAATIAAERRIAAE